MVTEILRTLCNEVLFLYPKKYICISSGCNHFERFPLHSLMIFLME